VGRFHARGGYDEGQQFTPVPLEAAMRKSTFALAVSFLAALVWFGAQLNQPRAAEDAGKHAIQKWEYRWQQSENTSPASLNEMGEQGWEACGVSHQTQNQNGTTTVSVTYVLLKRQKQ
jgi:hypothetical protein